jgi:hypothetical protein
MSEEVAMKAMIALAVALLALVPHLAEADPLIITRGFVIAVFGSEARFGGDDFSVTASEDIHSTESFVIPAFGVDPFTWTMSLGTATINVGSDECFVAEGDNPFCGGILTLTSPGFAMPTNWPPATLFGGTVPFTADGFLTIGGRQYDLHGEGNVTGNRCLDLSDCGIPYGIQPIPSRVGAMLTYAFTVPEPPTLLTTAFAVTIVGLGLVRRRVV